MGDSVTSELCIEILEERLLVPRTGWVLKEWEGKPEVVSCTT